MARWVQELLHSGRALAHLPGVGCRQSVRRIHLTYASYDELGPARQMLREQLATLQTSPVLFAFGGRHAAVTVIGIEHEPDGSDLQSTLTFAMVAVGRRWKVASLDERQRLVA